MDKAAANGHLDVVEWLHENRTEGVTPTGFADAAGASHLDVLKWLVDNRPDEICTNAALQAAVEQMRVDVVEWLLYQVHEVPRVVVAMADTSGYMNLILTLQKYHPEMVIAGNFLWAVRGGHLNVVEWMFNRGDTDARALNEAASYVHLHVVQWLHARSFPATTDAMDNACQNGHFHVVRWLHQHRDEGCTRFAMTCAIGNGHFSVVQWLHRHRLHDISGFSMANAARRGDLTMVEYLHTHHVDDSAAFKIAGGHFSVVQYLHRHRPEAVSSQDLDTAVSRANLVLAKWLVASGAVTITQTTIEAAVQSRDLTTLTWVLSRWDDELPSRLTTVATRCGRLSVLQCLRQVGCEVGKGAMGSAAANGHLAVLVALQSHRQIFSSTAMDCAVRRGHVQVVRWLQSNGAKGCVVSSIDEAAGRGHLAMVAYLHPEMYHASDKTLLIAANLNAVHVVKWLVSHGVSCTAEVLAWAEQHPTSASAQWLLRHQATRQGLPAPVGAKRRKVSHEDHSNDGRASRDTFEDA